MNDRPPLRLEYRDVAELNDNPKNWRRHPDKQLSALRDVIDEVGWAGALLYNERTGRLVDGHARKTVAQSNGKVPVLIGSWSEEEEAKILLTLDPLASMAQADSDSVTRLLSSIDIAKESDAVRALLDLVRDQARTEPTTLIEPPAPLDRAAELQRKWKTERGQLWRIGTHRLLCGDCRLAPDVARLWADGGPKPRMVWTDPPYGVDYAAKNTFLNRSDRGNRIQTPIENDKLTAAETGIMFKQALEVAREFAAPGAACYATVPSGPLLFYFFQAFTAAGFTFHAQLTWVKHHFVIGMADYHHRYEPILYGWLPDAAHYFVDDRSQDDVFEVDKPQVSEFHPTTKPVELIARMVANSSRSGELVYDPFCGSGSTLLAAHQLGRVGYGVEIDPGYLAVSLERLAVLGLKPELGQCKT